MLGVSMFGFRHPTSLTPRSSAKMKTIWGGGELVEEDTRQRRKAKISICQIYNLFYKYRARICQIQIENVQYKARICQTLNSAVLLSTFAYLELLTFLYRCSTQPSATLVSLSLSLILIQKIFSHYSKFNLI